MHHYKLKEESNYSEMYVMEGEEDEDSDKPLALPLL
jgi:hypothetical protein